MRAWTWWLLPFFYILSPSRLPGDSSTFSLASEVPLGAFISHAALSPNGREWLT